MLGKDCMTGSADLGRKPCNCFIGVGAVAYLAAVKRGPFRDACDDRRLRKDKYRMFKAGGRKRSDVEQGNHF